MSYKSEANADDAAKFDNSATISLNGTEKYVVAAKDGVNAGQAGDYEIKDRQGKLVATVTLTNADLGEGKDAKIVGTSDKGIGSETISASAAMAGYGNGETIKYYDRDGNGIPENALDGYFSSVTEGDTVTASARVDAPAIYDALGNKITADAGDVVSKQDLTGALTLTLHVGADATTNNQISLNIDAMSAKGLGVNGLKVDGTDDTNALGSIETIKEAIQKVSTQRSALGAVQNRLEHTINNLDNVVENTTAAESQIRDTDMAEEMVRYSNNNILMQAGQAMLAQANQANQGILSLLG